MRARGSPRLTSAPAGAPTARRPKDISPPQRANGALGSPTCFEGSGHIPSCHDAIVTRVPLPDAAYARLLALRTGLRHFQAWSAKQARAAGLTPAQHQLLLAIRGHPDPSGPTIGEVADYLLLRHHSAVELVDRAVAAGLVSRVRSDDDHRVVLLRLTEDGAARLEALSELHLEELDRLALDVPAAWAGLRPVNRPHGFPGEPEEEEKTAAGAVHEVAGAHAIHAARATGVLVERHGLTD